METELLPPFYVGQEVMADHPYAGSRIKNGQKYIISSCVWRQSSNPIANGKYFWYVGVEGHDNNWMTPKLFRAIIPPMQEINFEKISEHNPVSVN